MLSEARKYKLALILAHQNLSQLPRTLRDSILANCGIQACFRVNREDAQMLARELLSPLYIHRPGWEMNIQNLQELSPRTCYVANRTENGIIYMKTPDVPNPWELMQFEEKNGWESYDEETFRLLTSSLGFGFSYLRDRAEVEREYMDRGKNIANDKGMDDFKEAK
jgi:hypothetical protein